MNQKPLDDDHVVTLKLYRDLSRSRIEIDGQTVERVMNVRVHGDAGHLPLVTLTIAPDLVEVEAEAEVETE